MATKQEIMDTAKELGKQIAKNEVGKKLETAIGKLEADADAQRTMADYQRFIQTLGEKEAAGQPIEVEEKQKLQTMQNAVVHNLTLQQFQIAQMDYLDLMREVDQVISAQSTGQPGPGSHGSAPQQAAPSPLITPGM